LELLDPGVPFDLSLVTHPLGQALNVLGADAEIGQAPKHLAALRKGGRVSPGVLDPCQQGWAVALRPQVELTIQREKKFGGSAGKHAPVDGFRPPRLD
jgi:hypothetical protein